MIYRIIKSVEISTSNSFFYDHSILSPLLISLLFTQILVVWGGLRIHDFTEYTRYELEKSEKTNSFTLRLHDMH
jgi:hypothetical protein